MSLSAPAVWRPDHVSAPGVSDSFGVMPGVRYEPISGSNWRRSISRARSCSSRTTSATELTGAVGIPAADRMLLDLLGGRAAVQP